MMRISEKEVVFLTRTNRTPLERSLSNLVQGKNTGFSLAENFEGLKKNYPADQIITFIIGSDIENPIQCTQRLHAFSEKAKIILLSKSEQGVKTLKEAVKFSPFIGVDVFCLNESKETKLKEKLDEILQASHAAEKYRNIIEGTNADLALKTSSQRPAFNRHFIDRLLNIAPIGIVITNWQGKVLGWNNKAASIFERNESQALGTLLSEYLKPAAGKKLKNYLSRQSFEGSQSNLVEELSLERTSKDKSKQFLSLTAAPLPGSETENALILAIQDVTGRAQAKIELEEINKTLEERVDKRTAALKSYQKHLRSLVSELSKAEEQERQRLAAELHDNLGQMLAMGRMKVDQASKNPDEIPVLIEELRELFEDAITYTRELMSDLKPPPSLKNETVITSIRWVSEKMEKHGLEVTVKEDERPKSLSGEAQTTLIQCVRELLFNVLRHTSVNKAHVNINREDHYLVVTVEDKGVGFDTDQIESAPTEEKEFGLFSIRERINLLGGEIEIDSTLGEGTKVTLSIPQDVNGGESSSS